MVCSPSQKKFSKPDQHASRTTAIKPDARGVKQLDNGIDDTFVSSVREEVSFASIDFQDSLDGEKPYASGLKTLQSNENMGNTIVQLRGPLNWLDDFLYLPEVLYVLFFIWLICSGRGKFSVDYWLVGQLQR
jgi:hypothetical protein